MMKGLASFSNDELAAEVSNILSSKMVNHVLVLMIHRLE